MKTRLLLLIVSLLICTGLAITGAKCGKKPGQSELPKKTQRIVTLAPNLTEIVFALGLGEKIVAVSSDSDYPPDAKNKQTIGSFWQPDIEAVIVAKPDLVITLWFEQQRNVADSLKRLGIDTLTLKITNIRQLLEAVHQIGSAAGCRQNAKQLAQTLQNQINDLKIKCNSQSKPKVLWVIQTNPLRVAGRNTFKNEIIEIAGGKNAIGPTIQQYPQIDTEQLLLCQADVIIQSAMDKKDIALQQKAAHTYWAKKTNLPAVINNKIFVVDSDTVQRLGPRLPDGIKTIAALLHPELSEQEKNSKK